MLGEQSSSLQGQKQFPGNLVPSAAFWADDNGGQIHRPVFAVGIGRVWIEPDRLPARRCSRWDKMHHTGFSTTSPCRALVGEVLDRAAE